MADHKISNERKKELEQPDPFQENLLKAVKYVKTYKKQIGLIIGAIVLIGVVFSGVMYSFEKSEAAASTLLSQALKTYSQNENPAKGFESVKNDFETLFKDYANTSAGKIARIEYGKICYESGKYEDSFNNYKKALDLFRDQVELENFILISLGQTSLAKGDQDAAKKYFNRVEKSKTNLLKDEAIFALAMISEKNGDTAKSKDYYKKIVADFGSSVYVPVAKSKIVK